MDGYRTQQRHIANLLQPGDTDDLRVLCRDEESIQTSRRQIARRKPACFEQRANTVEIGDGCRTNLVVIRVHTNPSMN